MSRLTKKVKDTIFRGKRERQQEIQALIQMFEERTAGISKEEAFNQLDTKTSWDFILLLRIADDAQLGKTKSILYSYKLGYLAGLEASGKKVEQDG